MLQKIAPILPAYNIPDTILFYKNRLKFPTYNYGNYLLVKKDLIEIHYIEWKGSGKLVPGSCYLFDDNIEDLFSKFCSMDIPDSSGNLKTNAWGKKEFHIKDNNGNILRFGQVIE